MRKSFIWFDLGYTLVYRPRVQVFRQFLQENGVERTAEEIEIAYHLTDKLFMREYPGVLGKSDERFFLWYLGVLNYKLGVDFDLYAQNRRLSEIQRSIRSAWMPYPFARDVLQSLRESGLGVGLISNWDATARQVLDEGRLTDCFDHIVISSEVGFEKPTEQIFRHSLRKAGVSPEECCYVGDNYYDDVVGSARVGMDAVLINRFGSLGIEEIVHEPTILSIRELPALLAIPSWEESKK
jgi:putative hydrolase of the HAD superfamily